MEFTLLFSHFHFRYQQLTTTHTATSSSAARTRRCPLNFSPLFNKLFTRLPCTILLINPSPPEPEIREASTILALLSDQMEGVDSSRRRSRRTSLKERLGLKGLGCCGTTWGFSPTTIVTNDDPDTDEEQEEREAVVNTGQEERDSDPGCLDPNPSPNQQHSSGMNLAAALAAERQLREAGSNIMEPASVIDVGNTSVGSTGTPVRVSLMRLLEESTEGGGGGGGGEVVITETTGGGVWNDTVCCVCMGRKKGAAFIPCGHTFCRVCSRELWLNRGSCPLCNRSILEILDIF